jgi:hypothetical protein
MHMTDIEHPTNLRFFEVLREFSDDKNDPTPEWEFKGLITRGTHEKCICGTKIELNFLIVHKRTQKQLFIGSECVKRWIQPKLLCERCEAPLGRFEWRHKNQDFHCRSCKKEIQLEKEWQKMNQQMEAQRKKKKIEKMEKWTLFWYGKYRNKPFKMVAEDVGYVEYLMNIPEEKATASVRSFQEYASLIFEFEEVEVEVEV